MFPILVKQLLLMYRISLMVFILNIIITKHIIHIVYNHTYKIYWLKGVSERDKSCFFKWFSLENASK